MANKTASLPLYRILTTTDHDQKIKFEKQETFCYSKKQLDRLYPDGGYHLIGEVRSRNKKEAIATLAFGKKQIDITKYKSYHRLTNKCVGFVRVSKDDYVALLRSRIPFFILLFAGLAVLAVVIALLISLVASEPPPPIVIDPDYPMPTEDVNAKPNEDDDSQKAEVEEGGGSLSMIYSLEADLNLSTGEIKIYFMNPNASTHDTSLILYVISGEERIPIAQSGRVAAGYSLTEMTLVEGSAVLSEGIYTGLFQLSLFDPETGERALVQPEITGVELKVHN